MHAKAFEKADSEAANILRQIAEATKAGKGDTARALGDGSEPASAVAGQQPAFAANPETSSSQDDPIARGQSKDNIRSEKGKSNPESPKFSRALSKHDVEFAHDFLFELSDVDELFKHPISHKTSLEGVFADVYPGSVYVGDGTREDERDESGADHRHVLKSPQGKQFYVYERDNGEVFIDVSHLSTGEGGQAVYAAVANWAYNTKRKFIGDPAGLTADSLIRRTSNMLSAAIRFGTVKHLEAAPQQIVGDPKNGVPRWIGAEMMLQRSGH